MSSLIPNYLKNQKPVFQLLETQKVKNKNGEFVETQINRIEDYWRKKIKEVRFCEIAGYDADFLSKDFAYRQQSIKVFGPLAKILNKNYKQFLLNRFNIYF